VVVGRSSKDAFVEFLYIDHSTETQNNRRLEQDVERDLEGKIISCRRRGDTQVNCKWRCKSKSRKSRKSGVTWPACACAAFAPGHVSDSRKRGGRSDP
jgi:hypothetical protein